MFSRLQKKKKKIKQKGNDRNSGQKFIDISGHPCKIFEIQSFTGINLLAGLVTRFT